LRVFENRVPRRIFGPKRDEGTGGWRELYNEEPHNLYPSPDVIKMIKSRVGGACSAHGEMINTYKTLIAKLEGKRPVRRHMRKWEDNIIMDLR
jgi:hypothetical protein